MQRTALLLMSARQAVVENRRNIWRLARMRFGPRMFGLDGAGNIISFHAYGQNTRFGWISVTDGDSKYALMRPMHWQAATKRENMLAAALAAAAPGAAEAAAASAAPGTAPAGETVPKVEWSHEAPFARISLRDKRLRVHPFASRCYKTMYFALCAAVCFVVGVQYTRFRQWVNAPARAGLERIEEKVLYYPRTAVVSVAESQPGAAATQIAAPVVGTVVAAASGAARTLGYRSEADIAAERREEQARIEALTRIEDKERIEWRRYASIAGCVMIGLLCIL